MANEQNDTKVHILDKVVGEVELPKLNVDEFVGNKAVIESTEEHKGQYGYFIKVISSKITEHNGNDVKATRIFSLTELADGQIGWGSESKLAGFLKKHNVKHYAELVGKDVVITKSQENAQGESFLTF